MQDTHQPQKLEHACQHGINENSSDSRFISFDPVVANMDITGFASKDTVSLLNIAQKQTQFRMESTK
jgi:hypothetical protein